MLLHRFSSHTDSSSPHCQGGGSQIFTAQCAVQGEEADALYVVQSGVITCDMDFLALSSRQHLQQVSKQVTADCTGLIQHR